MDTKISLRSLFMNMKVNCKQWSIFSTQSATQFNLNDIRNEKGRNFSCSAFTTTPTVNLFLKKVFVLSSLYENKVPFTIPFQASPC